MIHLYVLSPRGDIMAIEVRIPTILRPYTDGAKNVEGKIGRAHV